MLGLVGKCVGAVLLRFWFPKSSLGLKECFEQVFVDHINFIINVLSVVQTVPQLAILLLWPLSLAGSLVRLVCVPLFSITWCSLARANERLSLNSLCRLSHFVIIGIGKTIAHCKLFFVLLYSGSDRALLYSLRYFFHTIPFSLLCSKR